MASVGPVAITAGRAGGWSLAACENASDSSFPSQAFNHSSLPGAMGSHGCSTE